MAEIATEVLVPENVGGDDELGHYVCCNDTHALCGKTLDPNSPWVEDDDEIDCVVCRDITVCTNCGAKFAPLPGGF